MRMNGNNHNHSKSNVKKKANELNNKDSNTEATNDKN